MRGQTAPTVQRGVQYTKATASEVSRTLFDASTRHSGNDLFATADIRSASNTALKSPQPRAAFRFDGPAPLWPHDHGPNVASAPYPTGRWPAGRQSRYQMRSIALEGVNGQWQVDA